MALNDAGLKLAGDGIREGITHIQIHDDDPGAAGTDNAIAGIARQPVVWSDVVSGIFNLELPVQFTGLPPNQDVLYVSLWSSAGTGSTPTGGTHYGNVALSGDLAANAVGKFMVTDIPVEVAAA